MRRSVTYQSTNTHLTHRIEIIFSNLPLNAIYWEICTDFPDNTLPLTMNSSVVSLASKRTNFFIKIFFIKVFNLLISIMTIDYVKRFFDTTLWTHWLSKILLLTRKWRGWRKFTHFSSVFRILSTLKSLGGLARMSDKRHELM